MPLTLTEFTSIVQHLQGLMLGQQQRVVFHGEQEQPQHATEPLIIAALDRFSVSIDRVTGLIEKAMAGQAQEQLTETPPKPRGRKPAAAAGNGQVQTPDPLGAPSTVQEPPASAPAAAPPKPATVAPEPGMPDFLNRAKPAAGVSPVPAATASPVPPEQPAAAVTSMYTEDQVKAVLRAYMNKYGADGPNRLTELLKGYGTTQFSSLPKERWAEVVAKANQEMML